MMAMAAYNLVRMRTLGQVRLDGRVMKSKHLEMGWLGVRASLHHRKTATPVSSNASGVGYFRSLIDHRERIAAQFMTTDTPHSFEVQSVIHARLTNASIQSDRSILTATGGTHEE